MFFIDKFLFEIKRFNKWINNLYKNKVNYLNLTIQKERNLLFFVYIKLFYWYN